MWFISAGYTPSSRQVTRYIARKVMTLKDIHFHDAILYSVAENTEYDTLAFEVSYPVDWQNGVYERKIITFTDFLNYEVHEGPFVGRPTFLGWSTVWHENERVVIRFETSAGYRQLAFRDVSIHDAR